MSFFNIHQTRSHTLPPFLPDQVDLNLKSTVISKEDITQQYIPVLSYIRWSTWTYSTNMHYPTYLYTWTYSTYL